MIAVEPALIVITDLSLAPQEVLLTRFGDLFVRARSGSVLALLRDKDRSARERIALGRPLSALARRAGQYFGVAERLDLALLLEADAMHLGEDSVSSEDARRLLGQRFLSRACHDPERVSDVDAHAVLLSPVFRARKGRPALGLSALARAKAAAQRVRLYALGGVDPTQAAACLSAGADGVAVIGAALGDEPEALVRALGIARS